MLTILALVASVLAEVFLQQPSYMRLSEDLESVKEAERRASKALERALYILLVRVASVCELEGHSDRFSIYYYHDERFVMLARRAKSPRWEKRGRESYPVNQGAIGKAWEADQGQALVQMSTGKDAWERAAKKQGFTKSEIDGIHMRSATLAALRVEGEGQSVGVMVMETTVSNRITQQHLDQIADSPVIRTLGELVAAVALLTPGAENLRPVGGDHTTPWKATRQRAVESAQSVPDSAPSDAA